ncbi:hypothetical protein K443DRAFT_120428 [Laccaria amethystina LaAM-08-1]|uniref:Uncharacterized protein n=1 Tax=Laccaria amethystina LaAM-08-1 TaxID=1095629 RepID=A0A0C9Y623_9AGAR|nr:hypothetical protein K443DRAFT_120428 [Laccaria amethystina LaAM-08-1]
MVAQRSVEEDREIRRCRCKGKEKGGKLRARKWKKEEYEVVKLIEAKRIQGSLSGGTYGQTWTSIARDFLPIMASSVSKKDLNGEEILDSDVHADEIVTQADDFSWDQLLLRVLDGDEEDNIV